MTTLSEPPPLLDPALAGRTLPTWAMPAAAVAVGVVSLLLFAGTGLQGRADFVVFAAVLYLVTQTVLSFRVEGRRQAVDRLFTTLVYLAFVLAALPLVLIVAYTVKRGIGAIDMTFLTHSMFRINPETAGGGIYHAIVGTLVQSLLATLIAAPLGI